MKQVIYLYQVFVSAAFRTGRTFFIKTNKEKYSTHLTVGGFIFSTEIHFTIFRVEFSPLLAKVLDVFHTIIVSRTTLNFAFYTDLNIT